MTASRRKAKAPLTVTQLSRAIARQYLWGVIDATTGQIVATERSRTMARDTAFRLGVHRDCRHLVRRLDVRVVGARA